MIKLFLRNIKKGFATNSSSYHSTLILTDEEYKKWKNGEVKFNGLKYDDINNEDTLEELGYYYYIEGEAERTLDSGEKVIAITYCETNEY